MTEDVPGGNVAEVLGHPTRYNGSEEGRASTSGGTRSNISMLYFWHGRTQSIGARIACTCMAIRLWDVVRHTVMKDLGEDERTR